MKFILLAVAACIVGCTSHTLPQNRISRIVLHEADGTEHSIRNVSGLGHLGGDVYVVADSSIYVGPLPAVRLASTIGVTGATSHADTLYLATPRGLRALTPTHSAIESIEIPARNVHPSISALSVDPRGRLWIGTDGFGLFVRDGQRIVGASTSRYVRALACHPDSSIWIGSDMGVLHLKDSSLRQYSEEITSEGIEIRDNIINMISTDREGTVWIGTSDGVNIVPNEVARHAMDAHHEVPSFDYIGRKGNALQCVLQRESPSRDWILGTDDGLFVLSAASLPEHHEHGDGDTPAPQNSARRISFQTDQTPAAVNALLWTADHGLLIGTTNGLIYMPADVISTMLEDR